jgi:hypothetical protein
LLKPGGLLILGVPIGQGAGANVTTFAECKDCDEIVFNAHRIYGPVRLPHLLSNFELVEFAPLGTQEALVARKVVPNQ